MDYKRSSKLGISESPAERHRRHDASLLTAHTVCRVTHVWVVLSVNTDDGYSKLVVQGNVGIYVEF